MKTSNVMGFPPRGSNHEGQRSLLIVSPQQHNLLNQLSSVMPEKSFINTLQQ
jgi:hypothetical protein